MLSAMLTERGLFLRWLVHSLCLKFNIVVRILGSIKEAEDQGIHLLKIIIIN